MTTASSINPTTEPHSHQLCPTRLKTAYRTQRAIRLRTALTASGQHSLRAVSFSDFRTATRATGTAHRVRGATEPMPVYSLFTVTVAEPLLPSLVAVTVAVPAPTAETVAKLGDVKMSCTTALSLTSHPTAR